MSDNRTMEKPLIVSFLTNHLAEMALTEIDCEVMSVPALGDMLKTELTQAPRLFLIEVPANAAD